jgi:signal transduction histidine kinase
MRNKKTFLLIITLAVLYFVTGKVIFFLLGSNSIITLGMFPPEGIALAFAIYFGKRVLPGVFLGQFLLAYFSGMGLGVSIAVSLINTLEAYIGIYLFNRFLLDKNLKHFRDYIYLFAIIAFILQPFSAIMSNTVIFVSNSLNTSFWSNVFAWWFGNVMGQIVFTPFLLLLFSRYREVDVVKFLVYGFLYLFYIFTVEMVFQVKNPFILIALSLFAVIFVTLKENILYGWFFSIIAAFAASYSVYLKTGAFAGESAFDNTVNYNFYILIHIISVIITGVLFEERKRYSEILEERVKEEVKKNSEKQLMLLQKNRHAQMGEAISMIAHQWKQPLNALSIMIQTLKIQFVKKGFDKDSFEKFTKNALSQINYMNETVNDFKNFFKDENEKTEFMLNDIIRKSVYMVNPMLKRDNIKLCVKEKSDVTYVGYPNNLMQTVINIINNARDVLNEKEVKDKEIIIELLDFEDKTVIKIEDNAGGIPEEIIDKIFDPYFSTKEKKGTGLGLYMSKTIIEEQMGGRLEVENGEKGAVFRIILYKRPAR